VRSIADSGAPIAPAGERGSLCFPVGQATSVLAPVACARVTTHRGQAVAPRSRRRRGEEGTGTLPGEKLFKAYMHPADSSNGRSCFYGPV
jgi:hypothetical protein